MRKEFVMIVKGDVPSIIQTGGNPTLDLVPYGFMAVMIVFIAAISQAWARGLSIDCGCFGGGGTVDPGETKYLSEILRDIGLALLALYLVRYPLTRFALEKLMKPKESK